MPKSTFQIELLFRINHTFDSNQASNIHVLNFLTCDSWHTYILTLTNLLKLKTNCNGFNSKLNIRDATQHTFLRNIKKSTNTKKLLRK